MQVCAKCHARINDGQTKCVYCGTNVPNPVPAPVTDLVALPAMTAPPPRPVAAAPAPVAASIPTKPSAPSAPLPANRKKGWLSRLYSGRMNRLSFLVGPFILQLILTVIVVVLSVLYGVIMTTNTKETEAFSVFLAFLVYIPAVIIGFSFSVRRCHDLGKKWTYLLWAFVPIMNIIVSFKLTFGQGTQGDNPFGPQPKQGVHLNQIFGNEQS